MFRKSHLGKYAHKFELNYQQITMVMMGIEGHIYELKNHHNIFMNWDIKPHIFELNCQHKLLLDRFLNKFWFNFKHKFNKSDRILEHMIYFTIVRNNLDPKDKLQHNRLLICQNTEVLYMLAYRL